MAIQFYTETTRVFETYLAILMDVLLLYARLSINDTQAASSHCYKQLECKGLRSRCLDLRDGRKRSSKQILKYSCQSIKRTDTSSQMLIRPLPKTPMPSLPSLSFQLEHSLVKVLLSFVDFTVVPVVLLGLGDSVVGWIGRSTRRQILGGL